MNRANNDVYFKLRNKLEANDLEVILMYLENERQSSGGDILRYSSDTTSNILKVTFEELETKERVLRKKHFKFLKHEFTSFEYYEDAEAALRASFAPSNKAIVLRNIKENDDLVALYVEYIVQDAEVDCIVKSGLLANTIIANFKTPFDMEGAKNRFQKRSTFQKQEISFYDALESTFYFMRNLKRNDPKALLGETLDILLKSNLFANEPCITLANYKDKFLLFSLENASIPDKFTFIEKFHSFDLLNSALDEVALDPVIEITAELEQSKLEDTNQPATEIPINDKKGGKQKNDAKLKAGSTNSLNKSEKGKNSKKNNEEKSASAGKGMPRPSSQSRLPSQQQQQQQQQPQQMAQQQQPQQMAQYQMIPPVSQIRPQHPMAPYHQSQPVMIPMMSVPKTPYFYTTQPPSQMPKKVIKIAAHSPLTLALAKCTKIMSDLQKSLYQSGSVLAYHQVEKIYLIEKMQENIVATGLSPHSMQIDFSEWLNKVTHVIGAYENAIHFAKVECGSVSAKIGDVLKEKIESINSSNSEVYLYLESNYLCMIGYEAQIKSVYNYFTKFLMDKLASSESSSITSSSTGDNEFEFEHANENFKMLICNCAQVFNDVCQNIKSANAKITKMNDSNNSNSKSFRLMVRKIDETQSGDFDAWKKSIYKKVNSFYDKQVFNHTVEYAIKPGDTRFLNFKPKFDAWIDKEKNYNFVYSFFISDKNASIRIMLSGFKNCVNKACKFLETMLGNGGNGDGDAQKVSVAVNSVEKPVKKQQQQQQQSAANGDEFYRISDVRFVQALCNCTELFAELNKVLNGNKANLQVDASNSLLVRKLTRDNMNYHNWLAKMKKLVNDFKTKYFFVRMFKADKVDKIVLAMIGDEVKSLVKKDSAKLCYQIEPSFVMISGFKEAVEALYAQLVAKYSLSLDAKEVPKHRGSISSESGASAASTPSSQHYKLSINLANEVKLPILFELRSSFFPQLEAKFMNKHKVKCVLNEQPMEIRLSSVDDSIHLNMTLKQWKSAMRAQLNNFFSMFLIKKVKLKENCEFTYDTKLIHIAKLPDNYVKVSGVKDDVLKLVEKIGVSPVPSAKSDSNNNASSVKESARINSPSTLARKQSSSKLVSESAAESTESMEDLMDNLSDDDLHKLFAKNYFYEISQRYKKLTLLCDAEKKRILFKGSRNDILNAKRYAYLLMSSS